MSPDPPGLGGGLHRQRYAEGDPLGFVDPIGLTAAPTMGVFNASTASSGDRFGAGAVSALAYAARELALVQLGNGDPDAAMDWLLRGVRSSPAPELFADLCASRKELSLLHDHPRWPELEAARRVGSATDSAAW